MPAILCICIFELRNACAGPSSDWRLHILPPNAAPPEWLFFLWLITVRCHRVVPFLRRTAFFPDQPSSPRTCQFAADYSLVSCFIMVLYMDSQEEGSCALVLRILFKCPLVLTSGSVQRRGIADWLRGLPMILSSVSPPALWLCWLYLPLDLIIAPACSTRTPRKCIRLNNNLLSYPLEERSPKWLE